MAANWWYQLVAPALNLDHARLVCDNVAQRITINDLTRSVADLESKLLEAKIASDKLNEEIKRLERPSLLGSWIHSQAAASKQRIGELERENAKMGLVRDALRNEKAYSLFLEDCLECQSPGEVFNALPLEKRKEYFDRAQ